MVQLPSYLEAGKAVKLGMSLLPPEPGFRVNISPEFGKLRLVCCGVVGGPARHRGPATRALPSTDPVPELGRGYVGTAKLNFDNIRRRHYFKWVFK